MYNTLNCSIALELRVIRAPSRQSKSEELSSKPKRKPRNLDVRGREYLLSEEVEAMMNAAAKVGRHPLRDRALILLMYRHGLRVSEVNSLRWHQIDLNRANIHIHRRKNGKPSVHPLYGDELRLLRRIGRDYPDTPYVFVSERKAPLSERIIHQIVQRAGKEACLDFPVHPHMLRHGCGYYLADKGFDTRVIQDYLGHRQIQHTVKYTELAPGRFVGLWD